jgi:hypothetical protein
MMYYLRQIGYTPLLIAYTTFSTLGEVVVILSIATPYRYYLKLTIATPYPYYMKEEQFTSSMILPSFNLHNFQCLRRSGIVIVYRRSCIHTACCDPL